MSSGSFISSFYEDDNLNIRPCRIQPETITAWNAAPTGPATRDRIRIGGGKNESGRKARYVRLVRNIGAVVDGIQPVQRLSVPVLTTAAFDAITEGGDLDYLGNTYRVTSKIGESGLRG